MKEYIGLFVGLFVGFICLAVPILLLIISICTSGVVDKLLNGQVAGFTNELIGRREKVPK